MQSEYFFSVFFYELQMIMMEVYYYCYYYLLAEKMVVLLAIDVVDCAPDVDEREGRLSLQCQVRKRMMRD